MAKLPTVDALTAADVLEVLDAVFLEFGHVAEDQCSAAYVSRDEAGRELDFHPLELDEVGNGWQPQLDDTRALWPREALQARGRIAGRNVRCTSPQFQVDSHLYEGHNDVDWAALLALCAEFALPVPAGGAPGFVQERRRICT